VIFARQRPRSDRARFRPTLGFDVRQLSAGVLLLATLGLIAHAALHPRLLFDSPFLAIDRSWFAFGQKFAAWYLPQTNLALNPYDDWAVVLALAFPGATSIFGAIVANPREFTAFEVHNLQALGSILGHALDGQPYHFEQVATGLLVVGAAMASVRGGARPGTALAAISRRRSPLVYLVSISLAALPSIAIAPAVVYSLPLFLLPFTVIIVVIDDLLRRGLGPRAMRGVWVGAVLVLVAWAVAPSPLDTGRGIRPQLDEVRMLGEVLVSERGPSPGVTMLDVGGTGYCAYLPYGTCAEVDASWRREGEPLEAFLRRRNVDAILVTPRLTGNRLFRDDAAFASLRARPEQSGWASYPLGEADILLIKRSGQG
jgi:hypothetical protein